MFEFFSFFLVRGILLLMLCVYICIYMLFYLSVHSKCNYIYEMQYNKLNENKIKLFLFLFIAKLNYHCTSLLLHLNHLELENILETCKISLIICLGFFLDLCEINEHRLDHFIQHSQRNNSIVIKKLTTTSWPS